MPPFVFMASLFRYLFNTTFLDNSKKTSNFEKLRYLQSHHSRLCLGRAGSITSTAKLGAKRLGPAVQFGNLGRSVDERSWCMDQLATSWQPGKWEVFFLLLLWLDSRLLQLGKCWPFFFGVFSQCFWYLI